MDLIKKFVKYYKPHRKLFILDITSAFFVAMIDLVFPAISRNIINEIVPNKNFDMLTKMILFLFGLFVIRGILRYIIHYWGHVVGVRMEADMRNKLFSHIQTQDIQFFDNTKVGHLMSRIVNDLRDISELAHHGPEDIFLSVIMFIGSFIILVQIEPTLTYILFSFVAIIVFYAITRRKKMRNAFRSVRKEIANVNTSIENSLSGVREAKTYTNEEMEYEKFLIGNTKFKESREYAFKSMAEFSTGIDFLMKFLNLIILGFGGYFIIIESIDYGDFVAFLMYINLFMEPVKRLTSFTQQFEQGMSGFERYCELLEIQPEINDKPDAIKFNEIKDKIEYKDVGFSYTEEGECVLENINLTIKKGSTLALVGPSGGGKTTISNLLPRFYDINKGKITIDGINIKNFKIKSLREKIGFVQQNIFIFSGTLKDNIRYGNTEATEEDIIEAAKNANIHEFIMSLPEQYNTDVGEKGIKLSGGQKQRISIARVFLKNPPILILDEATSALDNATEIKIQHSLEKLSKGRTTIVIAHRLSTIRDADEIIVISSEGIQERGNHEELIKQGGIYSKLYKAQFKGFIPDDIK
ncbi:MAG TPA: ABC transporter ATP-binding protein [Clostridia bacterium]|nr:ABC transporter ATP-binding protein [Clostridia bacterium]